MKLKEIASISGKPGLYRIFKQTRTGVIVESLDEKKLKMSIGTSHRVSVLKEVSIYTTTEESSVPLEKVLQTIYEEYKLELGLDGKSSNQALVTLIAKVVPDYDREKVYISDMKKLVNWYNILAKFSPETFEELGKEEEPIVDGENPENTEATITETESSNEVEEVVANQTSQEEAKPEVVETAIPQEEESETKKPKATKKTKSESEEASDKEAKEANKKSSKKKEA